MNTLILAAAVSLHGGLGYQFDYTPGVGNDYAYQIGELSLQYTHKTGVTAELFHLSGINTPEPDYGINAVFTGYEFSAGGFFATTGVGYNFSPNISTNEYGNVLLKTEIGIRANNGLYLKFVTIDEMKYLSTGFNLEW